MESNVRTQVELIEPTNPTLKRTIDKMNSSGCKVLPFIQCKHTHKLTLLSVRTETGVNREAVLSWTEMSS